MSEIILGPQLKLTDTSSLFDLLVQCQSAIAIRQRDPATLNALDDQSTIDALVNRLDDQLRLRWMEHRQDVKPTFQFFAQWIKDRAKISRLNRDTSVPRQSQTHTEASSIKIPISTSSNLNTKRQL